MLDHTGCADDNTLLGWLPPVISQSDLRDIVPALKGDLYHCPHLLPPDTVLPDRSCFDIQGRVVSGMNEAVVFNSVAVLFCVYCSVMSLYSWVVIQRRTATRECNDVGAAVETRRKSVRTGEQSLPAA
jgi:hypothetical protein